MLCLTLLIGLDGIFTPNGPVDAQEIESTPTPVAASTPISTANPPVAVAPPDGTADLARLDGLFYEVDGDPPPNIGVDTLASRLVGIDFGQLAQAIESPVGPKDPVTGEPPSPKTLVLNLFDDVVFTGMVEHVEPTSSGHSLWGRLDGVGLGTFTLVVNGRMVIGTARAMPRIQLRGSSPLPLHLKPDSGSLC